MSTTPSLLCFFFFSSRRRHTRLQGDWSSDVCSSDLCTVHVRRDGCDIWVGTQVPTFARTAAAKLTGLPRERVQVHNHLLGGGFGRRLEVDFIIRAVQIATQVSGPVKVVWTREEDIQHDMYRPYY